MIPEVVQQNFVGPLGLTALLSLIPLIIFYLVKPKPVREVMPSMAFFQENKDKGRIRNALNKLKMNKLFFLHFLFVLVAAAAIANPLVAGLESEGSAVIVVDVSASVAEDQGDVKSFALSNLAEKNTVVKAGSSSEVLIRDASPERAKRAINSIENSGSGTDLVSGLQTASSFPGDIFLASDMSHTGSTMLDNVLEDVSEDTTVQVMSLDHENSHGFTGMKVQGQTVSVTVQNFLQVNNSVTLRKPGENIQEELGPGSVESFSFDLESGAHELKLPKDESTIDNTLYVSIPQNDDIKVKRLGSESRYFTKAVQLINSTEYVSGDSLTGADVYYVSRGYSLGQEEIETIRDSLNQGSSVFAFESRENLPDFVPVENRTGVQNRTVTVNQGLPTQFRSKVTGYDVKGLSLSQPEEAVALSEDEDVLFYNVEDESFGKEVTYPLFWKNTILNMTDRPTSEELNMKTGETVNFEKQVTKSDRTHQGRTVIESKGFYTGDKTYAANILNAEELAPYKNEFTDTENSGSENGRDPARKYLATLLIFLSLSELLYLSRRGAL